MTDTRLAVDREESRVNVRFQPRTLAILTKEAERRHITVPALIRLLVVDRLDELELLS